MRIQEFFSFEKYDKTSYYWDFCAIVLRFMMKPFIIKIINVYQIF